MPAQTQSRHEEAPLDLKRALRALWIVGVWSTLVWAATRGTLLFGMDRIAHGSDLVRTQLRLAAALPDVVLRSGFFAFTICCVFVVSGAIRKRGVRWPLLGAVLVAATLVGQSLLAGWDVDDASRAVGHDTQRGRMVGHVLLGIAGLYSAASLFAADRARGAVCRLSWSVLPLLLLVGVPLGIRIAYSSIGNRMAIRKTLVDVLAVPDAWTVVDGRRDAPPGIESLCPSVDYRIAGADMPSLMIAPPGEVSFRAPEGHGPLVLNTRAGIHHTLVAPESAWLKRGTIRFEVRVDDKGRKRIDIPIEPQGGRFPGTEWVPVGGESGLWVAPGSEVRLKTLFLDEDGIEKKPSEALRVGFGGLSFERRWSTERTLSSSDKPNVILIVMDTLRADRMDVYGYAKPTTPNLSRLAQRGIVYERAYSTASWTWPSTASILTGKLPQEHGVQDEASAYLSGLNMTVAEALQEQGLTTAAFSANILIVPDKNFDQGFEFFDHGSGGTRPSNVVMPAVLEWVEATAPTRFFLYLHLADPHAPLDPLPEGRRLFAADVPRDFSSRQANEHQHRLLDGCGYTDDGRSILNECVPEQEQIWVHQLYDACVWSGDHQVGRLIELLERLEIADETIIAFTSDHGEELYEHGFATHGHGLHEELVHVPLILAGPRLRPGQRIAAPVANRHLAPTLAKLAGAAFEGASDPLDLSQPSEITQGQTGGILTSTNAGWWKGRYRTRLLGLRKGTLSLHYAPEGAPWGTVEPSALGDWKLYDLARDPDQEEDLSRVRSDEAESLRKELERRILELNARRPSSPLLEAGEATLERLKAIGYVQD
ncbi:MAG: hypothetical protein CMJ89_01085 [Planctomycetes bacterium]|nr:hypothetical protein [Planctomycetota bacterium]